MSNELWQQAKQALARAMALPEAERASYLAQLQTSSPEVHVEVASLLAAQVAADQQGFLGDNDDTLVQAGTDNDDTKEQYHTQTYDPDRTREYISSDEHVDMLGDEHVDMLGDEHVDMLGDNIVGMAGDRNVGMAGDRNVDTGPRPRSQLHDLVGDEYELEKKIGQGGMGVVYKAYHRSLRRTVALKIITGGGLRDEIDIARFHIEAEAAARLDHPGIIPVYDVGEHNGNHYYAMAYVEGPSLSQFVGKNAKLLKPRRAAELMEHVCQAVQFAHDRAVIHRDLKPANIMLENGEVPRLADFGLAKNMHEEDGLTMTGQVMGTPSYMAPEQATGKLDEISNRTDVYSLGATLYALLAGKPPFSGGTMLETIRQVVRTEPESLTHVSHPVPRDLQIICEKCLAKSPQDRYASAADVAQDLRRYLDGFPISARPLAAWARGLRWCQRNPLEAALLTVTATALIVGTIVSVRFGLEANRSLAEANQNAQQLRSAIKSAFVFASEDVLAQEPGMQAARAVLLKTAQQYYGELVELTPRNADSQRELAEAQFMLSKVQMALGQDEAASNTLNEALAAQQALLRAVPNNAAALTALAKTHNQLARLIQERWQKLTQLQAIGKLPAEQADETDRQLDQWQDHAAEVTRLRQQVVALLPQDVESLNLLAEATMNQGAALATRGYARKQLVEQDRARQLMLEAQRIRSGVLGEHPQQSRVRRALARGYYNMANIELRAADQEHGEAYHERLSRSVDDLSQAIAAYRQLPATEQVLDTSLEFANCYRLRADAAFQMVRLEMAADDYQQAEKLLDRLANRNPTVYRYRIRLAETQFNFCMFWFNQQQDDRARRQFARSRATLLQAIRVDPNNLDAADQLVRFTQSLVVPLLEKKDFDMADLVVREAMQELLALQQESEEYSELAPSLEKLKSTARQVLEQREKAEVPADVT